ncbi:hypothetical protein BV22DRAFT_1007244 [Leucogyrophana mollusca]|uniref:Uncharacterized protein n=1 Tax=Leucogyrophana mollusca TaxID=85980 RepID=A0ACB8BN29_9AGAM|nr:hypothetical protein BV22DRAFT_1007244 [Leucogyrophana mollusca]
MNEKELTQKEKELRRETENLKQRLVEVSKREKEVATLFEECRDHAAKAALKQLEDHFTCPLCFEIMACPYSLNPRLCGHTFCATCILKWFFSRVHRACANWHEAVDCPMCRSQLCCTPDRIPRPEFTFPFTPNRTVDSVIRSLINVLSTKADSSNRSLTNTFIEWAEDGHAMIEWEKRDADGRDEMNSLGACWVTMKPTDILNIKARLEV